ncbi:hypothetical protein CLHUN_30040 [Ruminiclostridium hungatei]|uniref:Uncharacterized protein n=1 Tax=Ruminiclostridium hungatei TaxID=48256 RepID=A0A1V4SGY7_RUMHU|nr:hypothetical protein CLHUN_30040 [Ruminiclostridium hungatei]
MSTEGYQLYQLAGATDKYLKNPDMGGEKYQYLKHLSC